MRGSKKPCPGCGEVKFGRPANKVCDYCERLLKQAAWMEDQLSKLDGDEVVVSVGERAHWNKYILTHSGKAGRNLMDIFYRVSLAGSRPVLAKDAEYHLLGKYGQFGSSYMKVAMPRSLAEAIRDLHIGTIDALKLEYEKGKKDGHNLLVRLASGDLAPNDFLEKTESKEIK